MRAQEPSYITTVLGNGQICPISEIIGRRRVRQIDPDSAEGKRLLQTGRVTILAREGQRFSGTPIVKVFDHLASEVSREVKDPDTDPRAVHELTQLLDTIQRQRRAFS